eukprot:CAMPEP_0174720428 /NCGR_PEP_ID=MMETSP1094-20130205/33525_1 /TAXON_ID=156173 /ORGANISM="Chrysochromulina brevifilum, Strain UTEX LB 985" /LENGTH=60 /DNA_ID=CAMNT_0015920907 /DNA_START=203 /DNA_END=381 /DNA_ORIENTATION=+
MHMLRTKGASKAPPCTGAMCAGVQVAGVQAAEDPLHVRSGRWIGGEGVTLSHALGISAML